SSISLREGVFTHHGNIAVFDRFCVGSCKPGHRPPKTLRLFFSGRCLWFLSFCERFDTAGDPCSCRRRPHFFSVCMAKRCRSRTHLGTSRQSLVLAPYNSGDCVHYFVCSYTSPRQAVTTMRSQIRG